MSDYFPSVATQGSPALVKDHILNRQINPQYTPKSQKNKERKELHSIIAIGDPIVDISSEIDSEIIKKHNLKWGDTVFLDGNSNDTGVFDDLESMPEVKYIPGGSVQNTLRVASWCLNMDQNNRNNFKLTMLGCVGEDMYKVKILNALKDANVNPLLQTLENEKTSRCGAGIYKKERLLITQLRASKKLSEDFIDQNLEQILSHEVLIIEGYILQSKLNICQKLCQAFNREKKLVVLTLSAVFMIQFHKEKIIEIGNKSDIIIGNYAEAQELAEEKGNNTKSIFEKIFKKLVPRDRLLVVTCGANGVYCSKYDYKRNQLDFLMQYYTKKLKNEEIVDLNGAGDSFLGGFISEYIKGSSLYECCKVGNDAANVILHNVGCTFPNNMEFDSLN
jgi:adenosine kinase